MGRISQTITFVVDLVPTAAQWQNQADSVFNLLNGEIDTANVDSVSADGIMTMGEAQTVTGTKTWNKLQIFIGSYDKYIRIGTATGGFLWYDATNAVFRVKHGSAPTSEADGAPIMEG